ncbi:hypothetical protein AAGS61_01755 [Lysinibacillus sp. KU-BSD001]|uniref:hypothetical protein n=1 Tax=Lysinibacillus sp. KU-BSD001 TaxID=3141328 RepID=UPI0036E85AB0
MAKEIESKVELVDAEKVGEVITSKLPKFNKSQLVTSRKYIHRRDALNALLKEDEQYTFAQVDKILKQFDEGGKK